MALSVQVARELRNELTILEGARAAIDQKIRALQCVLTDGRRVADEPLLNVVEGNGKAHVPRRRKPTPLRARVLATLQRFSRCTSAEVLANLESRGVQVGGTTTLRERVSHELSRLRRKGVVRRAADGRYELAAAGTVDAPESLSRDERHVNDAAIP